MEQNLQQLTMVDSSTPPPTQALLGLPEQVPVPTIGPQLLQAVMEQNLQQSSITDTSTPPPTQVLTGQSHLGVFVIGNRSPRVVTEENLRRLPMADLSTPPPTQALIGNREQIRVHAIGNHLLQAVMAQNWQPL